MQRSIAVIAADIRRNWKNVYFGAIPYLEAMRNLEAPGDKYGQDSARSIIAYFLSNARAWRGPEAKAIKAELNAMLK